MGSDVLIFQCTQCEKTYQTGYLLRLHHRRIHTARRFICHHCKFESKFKYGLKEHIVRAHLNKNEKTTGFRYTCPSCPFEATDRSGMLKHYESDHDIQVTESTLEFNNNDEFLEWKRGLELRDSCQFVVARGEQRTSRGVTKYLRCSRDGFTRIRGEGKRKPKMKGSNKMNALCPSSIKVQQQTALGRVLVTYVGPHAGHSRDLGRLRLSDLERNDIAQKLAANVPVDAILNSIREDSICNGNYSRLHLITRKDLLNLKRRVKDGWSIPNNLTPGEPSANNCLIKQPGEELEECKRRLLTKMTNIIESIQTFDEYEQVQTAIRHLPCTSEAQGGVVNEFLTFSDVSGKPQFEMKAERL